MRTFDYDVIIAGGGVTGCAIARELSRYALDICLLEREEDVCSGTSKANSAIVHAGFDAAPGSMKAQMNVAGSRLMPDLARELDVPFRQNGSMVLCLSPDDRPALEALYRRGLTNGVEGLSLLTGEEARALEPHLTQAVAASSQVLGQLIFHSKYSSLVISPACSSCWRKSHSLINSSTRP